MKPRLVRRMALALLTVLGIAVVGGVVLWWFMNSENGVRWAQQVIHKRFPDVATITPAALNTWLQERDRPQPLIIDVRTREEQEASTLPGARCVAPETPVEQVLEGVGRDRPVVVYCASGYRAAVMARRLAKAGCASVQNLDGGIFGWANAGFPVEKNGIPTSEVHPYSSLFARMLKQRAK